MYLDTGRFSGFQYVAPQALHATEQHTAMQAPGAVEIPFAPGRLPRRSPPPFFSSSLLPFHFTSLPFLSLQHLSFPITKPVTLASRALSGSTKQLFSRLDTVRLIVRLLHHRLCTCCATPVLRCLFFSVAAFTGALPQTHKAYPPPSPTYQTRGSAPRPF